MIASRASAPAASRRPDRRELLVFALADRVAVLLLEGHARGMEAGGRDRVAEDHREEVVRRAVEVLDPLAVELAGDGRAVQLVDPVMRRVGDLVVLGISVGREEVVREAELVGVDVEHRRVGADGLELAVGLRLRPGEPVAVHVEAVQVPPGLLLATVRVLGRQDDDEGVGQDVVDDAVLARGQLVEGVERGVRAALLVAVDVARDPQDRRRVGQRVFERRATR